MWGGLTSAITKTQDYGVIYEPRDVFGSLANPNPKQKKSHSVVQYWEGVYLNSEYVAIVTAKAALTGASNAHAIDIGGGGWAVVWTIDTEGAWANA